MVNADGSVDIEGIDFSAADMWLKCGEQYRRRYIEGVKSPPGLAMIEGTSHHHSMEMDNKSKRDKGKQLTAKHLTELFEHKLDEETTKAKGECEKAKVEFDWEGEDRGRLLARAKILHVDWHGKSPKFDPDIVEDPFTKRVKAGGVEFTMYGQTDLTTKAPAVWDFKTSGKAKNQKDVDENLQLTVYSWVHQIPDVGIIALVKTATPYVQIVPSTRTPGQWVWGMRAIASAVQAIRRGVFPITNPGQFPAPWWCSGRFCGYYSDCRGKYDPEPESPPTQKG